MAEVSSEFTTTCSQKNFGVPYLLLVFHFVALNFNIFYSEGLAKIINLDELHVGNRLSFLVPQGAIEEQNARVADLSAHTRVANFLIEHDTVEDLTVFEEISKDFSILA